MASITRESNGRRTVQFVAADGKRRSIRLGKASQRAAETFKVRVEELLVAKLTGRPVEAETARWLVGLPQTMSDRLANVGLIVPRVAVGTVTLGEHLKNYFAKRTDVKPATATNWKHSRRCLLAFFGDHRLLSSITAGDAADWERWLKTGKARMNRYDERETDEGLAPNTLRKRVSNAKQFFQDAVSRDLIAKNPFGGLKGTVGGNRERDYFVTREVAEKVINACPDLEWRLLFALSRFGGLRCPSGAPRVNLGRRKLGGRADARAVTEDGTSLRERNPSRADLPRAAAVFGSRLGRRRAGGVVCHHAIPRRQCESTNAIKPHYTPRWGEAVAQAVSQLASKPRDGACQRTPSTCGRGVAGTLNAGGSQALLASDRCRLLEGHSAWRGSGAKCGAASARDG